MPIYAKDLKDPLEHIFTYVDDDGTNTHIHAARLREWCLKTKGLEIFNIPISKSLARKYLVENRVARERVQQLTAEHLKEPMIFCKDGTFDIRGYPDVFHVDGHHRYVWHAMMKNEFALAWVLDVEQWQDFKVVGMPAITAQQLIDIPILKRNY